MPGNGHPLNAIEKGLTMAKEKAKKKKKKPVKKAALMDSFVDAALKELGPSGIFTPSGKATRHVGIPFNVLSLEFLFGSTVLWLGSSYGLAGPTQSFKSSLATELMRLVLQYDGRGVTVETEGGKISEVMLDSVLGSLRPQHQIMLVDSVERAQSALTFSYNWFEKTFPKHNQLGAIMIDSLFGSAGDEKLRAIEKSGHGERAFPVEALLWSQWLQVFSPKLRDKPIILLFVNHLKRQMDGDNWRHPGGDAQDFYSSVYMHVSRVRSHDGVDTAINQLQIKTVKHSYYLAGRRIFVPYVFDKARNRLYFDWGHSTADLLASDIVPSVVKDVLKVNTSSKSMTALSRTFSCKQMGMSGVSGTELGDAIHKDAAIMDQLRQVLHINRYDTWKGIMPIALDEEHDHEPSDLEEAEGSKDDTLDL